MALLETLKNQTQSLKDQYIQKTIEWAINDFAEQKKWAADYNLGKFGFGVASKKYYRLPYYITNSNGKVEQHIEKMVNAANEHYESSIIKLAAKIQTKGLDESKLQVQTSHIGINIETTLTDGIKTIRAFTILAFGCIQKPHYRYLIK